MSKYTIGDWLAEISGSKRLLLKLRDLCKKSFVWFVGAPPVIDRRLNGSGGVGGLSPRGIFGGAVKVDFLLRNSVSGLLGKWRLEAMMLMAEFLRI